MIINNKIKNKIIMVIWVKIVIHFIIWVKINHIKEEGLDKLVVINLIIDKINIVNLCKKCNQITYKTNNLNIYIKIQDNLLIINLMQII